MNSVKALYLLRKWAQRFNCKAVEKGLNVCIEISIDVNSRTCFTEPEFINAPVIIVRDRPTPGSCLYGSFREAIACPSASDLFKVSREFSILEYAK